MKIIRKVASATHYQQYMDMYFMNQKFRRFCLSRLGESRATAWKKPWKPIVAADLTAWEPCIGKSTRRLAVFRGEHRLQQQLERHSIIGCENVFAPSHSGKIR
jgi:hypothetical protein